MAQSMAIALVELKQFFDTQFELTQASLREGDSERLIKNKINGFIIALQDKLFELKPNLMCSGCGKAANNLSIGQQTPLSNIRRDPTMNSDAIRVEPNINRNSNLDETDILRSRFSQQTQQQNPIMTAGVGSQMSQPGRNVPQYGSMLATSNQNRNPMLMQSFSSHAPIMTPPNGASNHHQAQP